MANCLSSMPNNKLIKLWIRQGGAMSAEQMRIIASELKGIKITSLGERIAASRKARGWSPTKFATEMKVSKATVSDWEAGKIKNLRLENLFAMCDCLDVNARWLGIGVGSPNRQLMHDEDEFELIALFRELQDDSKQALLSVARAMHTKDLGTATSKLKPFKHAVNPKH